jgi:putative sterol carrier protein
MPKTAAELFDALGRRGHEPLLEQATGTLRFELENGKPERWFVQVDRGDIVVSHANRKADATVRTDAQLFDRMVRGEVNATAAVLRGAVTVEGDPQLLTVFQRLFPGPQDG